MASDHQRSQCCFEEWMMSQEQELRELLEALNHRSEKSENDATAVSSTTSAESSRYTQLAEKSINSFKDYIDKRNQLCRHDASGFFSPSWNTALENSLLWIAGCRPSAYFRLTYALCGSQADFHLPQGHGQGLTTTTTTTTSSRGNYIVNDLGHISAAQLRMINDLHMKTIKEEERLSTQLASLQENIADQPIAVVARWLNRVGDSSGEVNRALDDHDRGLANLMEEADKLRLTTLKELLAILTPVQGVDLLAAAKKLHLCLHQWGKTRDHIHGRKN